MTVTFNETTNTTAPVGVPEQAAEPPPAPQAEWVRVADEKYRHLHVIPDWPLEVKSRDTVYQTIKVWLPPGWGFHDQVRRGKRDDGTQQDYLEIQTRRTTPADPPETVIPQVPLPEEYQGLDEIGIRAALAALLERNERTISALHAEAIQRRMCETFDNIMQQAGWPPRPKNWVITVAVEAVEHEYTASEFQKKFLPSATGTLELKRGERFVFREKLQVQVRAMRQGKPKKTDNILDMVSLETLLDAFRTSHGKLADQLNADSEFKIVEAYT